MMYRRETKKITIPEKNRTSRNSDLTCPLLSKNGWSTKRNGERKRIIPTIMKT